MARVLVVIPAFNEATIIESVIKSIPKKIKPDFNLAVLVVDDGSIDLTYEMVSKTKAKVVRHIINRGLGAALATGFRYALKYHYDYVVTFDADGQHYPEDIEKMLTALVLENIEVVIGNRLHSKTIMPITRLIVNTISNILTFVLFGIWTSDSQSGFRAFSRKALEKIEIRSQRMEVSSEIFREIKKHNLSFIEVPIGIRYTPYSLRKGQSLSNAPNVFLRLLMNRFN